MSDVLLPRRGTVIAWTTQGFPPGAPYAGPTGKDFVPFGVGLVQLGDKVRVEGRLTAATTRDRDAVNQGGTGFDAQSAGCI